MTKPVDRLTPQTIRLLFDYDGHSLIPRPGIKARRKMQKRGYVEIVLGKNEIYLREHRLVWAWVHGEHAAGDIDHINGDRTDNRIENLRAVTRSENLENKRRPQRNNRTGYLGVSFNRGRYQACIQVRGIQKHLGLFDTPEAAHQAYLDAKRKLHAGCTI